MGGARRILGQGRDTATKTPDVSFGRREAVTDRARRLPPVAGHGAGFGWSHGRRRHGRGQVTACGDNDTCQPAAAARRLGAELREQHVPDTPP